MDGALMRYLILLAMMLLPASSFAWGPVAVIAGRAPVCTAAVTGETGDTSNYLSAWSLTGGTCGTLYYRAGWASGEGSWDVWFYSDAGRAQLVGHGTTWGDTVPISGSVSGSVAVVNGPAESDITFTGTLTR